MTVTVDWHRKRPTPWYTALLFYVRDPNDLSWVDTYACCFYAGLGQAWYAGSTICWMGSCLRTDSIVPIILFLSRSKIHCPSKGTDPLIVLLAALFMLLAVSCCFRTALNSPAGD